MTDYLLPTGGGSGDGSNDGGGSGFGGGPPRLRVYELAKELGLSPKDMVAKVRSLGIDVANHMSLLEPADVERIRTAVMRDRHENLVESRVNDTIIRRRSRMSPNASELVRGPSLTAQSDVEPETSIEERY